MTDVLLCNGKLVLEKLDKINWDFSGEQTQYLTHKFHSYPARFIPQIPKTFIELFTKKGDTVLDPFCGCGTTLVEAILSKRRAMGNDYNPLAVLISKVKTTLITKKDLSCFDKNKMVKRRWSGTVNKLPSRKLSKHFTKKVLQSIYNIKGFLQELKDGKSIDLYDFGRVALSSSIWSFIDNKGKQDIQTAFWKKIEMMKKEILNLNGSVLAVCGDSRKLALDDNFIDLIVTSPPYVNALDYYREHMYNMHFLDMDVSHFKENEIGCHSKFLSNRFKLLFEYLSDMLRAMIEMNRVLKKGKFCVIVVGNSSLEYELIESHRFFSSFAASIGFKHHKSIFRNIAKGKKYTSEKIGQIDDEYIVVLEKINDSSFKTSDNNFVSGQVKKQMELFREQIKINPGSSMRGKKPTKKRLQQNLQKITEAMELVF